MYLHQSNKSKWFDKVTIPKISLRIDGSLLVIEPHKKLPFNYEKTIALCTPVFTIFYNLHTFSRKLH